MSHYLQKSFPAHTHPISLNPTTSRMGNTISRPSSPPVTPTNYNPNRRSALIYLKALDSMHPITEPNVNVRHQMAARNAAAESEYLLARARSRQQRLDQVDSKVKRKNVLRKARRQYGDGSRKGDWRGQMF